MLNNQESDQSAGELGNNSEDPNSILAHLRANVPPLPKLTQNPEKFERATSAVRTKIEKILRDYTGSPNKSLVGDMISQAVAMGCVAYGIDPVELIIIPRPIQQSENHIAMAGRKKVGPIDIKQLFIDPEEIMFREELLKQHGDKTAKNVTDLMFVFMHEVTHLGQMIHAEEDVNKSKQFAYTVRPTERHADEVALTYCKNLDAFLQERPDRNMGDRILLQGLPQTIKDATVNRRPSM